MRASTTYVTRQRIDLYRKAQRILARDIPMVPLYRLGRVQRAAVDPRGVQRANHAVLRSRGLAFEPEGYANASRPVTSLPMMSVCISLVPS